LPAPHLHLGETVYLIRFDVVNLERQHVFTPS
jgi:hypothetical protein